jgi:hypothetical protein
MWASAITVLLLLLLLGCWRLRSTLHHLWHSSSGTRHRIGAGYEVGLPGAGACRLAHGAGTLLCRRQHVQHLSHIAQVQMQTWLARRYCWFAALLL